MAFIFIIVMASFGISLILTPLYQKNKVVATIAFVILVGFWGICTLSLLSDSGNTSLISPNYIVLGVR